MKALTTLIALAISLFTITFPAPSVAPVSGNTPEAKVSSADGPLSHVAREIPVQLNPWYADYPLTRDVAGARIYASGHDTVDEARHVLELFAEANMKLPPLEIWTHEDLNGCRLSAEDVTPPAGVYFQRGGVDIVFHCGTTFTLIHELAHAHDNNFLTDSQRDEFLSIRNADSWRHEKWERAAGEHFADVVAWGLSKGEVRPSRTFPNDSASLDEAFALASRFASGHVVSGGSAEERMRVREGIELYEAAGLPLPPLRIHLHDNLDGCNGHAGLFNKDGSGDRIDICGDVIRHELAHAWTFHNLTDLVRQEFVSHAKLTTWGDQSIPHGKRGIEQAANVLSWGVTPRSLTESEVVMYDEFLFRYELLTGLASPRLPPA